MVNCENQESLENIPQNVPKWLTIQFVQESLRSFFKCDKVEVINTIISISGGCGDSYASSMFRVSAFYHQNNPLNVKMKPLIIKSLPQNEMANDRLGEKHFNVQKKEMMFYEKIYPKLEEILGGNEKIIPTLIAVNYDHDVIILEDLKERNFLMADRLKGLDVIHLKLSLTTLVKIHAASILLHEKDKSVYDGFEIGLYNRKTTAFDRMYLSNLEVFTESVASWTEWDQSAYFATKLKALQGNLIENGCKTFDYNDKNLNVFLHGDFWTNNIMFAYDSENNPSKATIIDFQYGFYGSAALDLLYFLFSSANDHLRIERMEEFVQFYYYELKKLLLKLNYNTKQLPSLLDFQIEYLKKYFYGFSTCLLTVPTMINQEKDSSFEAVMGLDEKSMDFKRRIYKNPRVKKLAMETLPIFDRRGIFDDI